MIFLKFNLNRTKKKVKKAVLENNKKDRDILNLENLKNILGNSEDIKYRDILINNDKNMTVNLICVDGLVNPSDISNYVIKPLIQEERINKAENLEEVIDIVRSGALYFISQTETTNLQKAVGELMSGGTILLFSNQNIAFVFDTKGFEKRAMVEPTVENVSKGPKDSFVENYRTNTATIRRKIKTPDLIIENTIIGQQTKTTVAIVYIKSIINEKILEGVREKLSKINTDNVINTSIIQDALSENITTVFPQVVSTERPDKLCAGVLEGRAGIIIDGTPFGFIVPATAVQFMQSAEDYSHKYVVASIVRMIRVLSLIIAVSLPALYIAITTFHPDMIPTNLAMFLAKSREGVTFPIALEAIAMLIAFEILFEAGLRVPRTIGTAVSIVGTLVIGQAASEAKLVSPAIVVIIATTAIATFTIPNQDFSNAIRLWRIVLAVFSTSLGLLGFVLCEILMVFELSKIESYGVSYMAPFVSNDGKNTLNDTIFRIPLRSNKQRPMSLSPKNIKRQSD